MFVIPSAFSSLVDVVKKDHFLVPPVGGHDINHVMRVAQTARIICEEKRTSELAWVAGMMHNSDRLFPAPDLEQEIISRLAELPLSDEEKNVVLRAVLHHHEPNSPDDDVVAIALKDADRVSEIGALFALRSAQFLWDKPIYNPQNPLNIGDTSVDRSVDVATNLRRILEWESKPNVCLRNSRAIQLAGPGFDFLRLLLADMERQLRAIEMI